MTQARDEPGQQEGLGSQASAKVQEAASVAQEKASELKEQGSARLRDQFEQRSTEAGSQVQSLAEALRRSGNDLSSEGKSGAAHVAEQVADRLDRVGTYLQQRSGDELMGDVEGFARRRPWLIAGVGMLVGVVAARFMKASSQRRYEDYRRAGQQWSPAVPASPGYAQPELASRSGAFVAEPRGMQDTARDDPLVRDPLAGKR